MRSSVVQIVPVTLVMTWMRNAIILGSLTVCSRAYQMRPQSGSKPRSGPWKWSYRILEEDAVQETSGILTSNSYQDSVFGPNVISAKVSREKNTQKKDNYVIDNVESLRSLVLDQQKELREIKIENYVKNVLVDENHEVLQLISQRYHSFSTPGNRQDNATLALAIEGGGMRGSVSAGMAAAIASLGLTDAFDKIYGSSAGSVIGAYMISRQMCVDVYVDILPAARELFVCKRRLVRSIATSLAGFLVSSMKQKTSKNQKKPSYSTSLPGMNISYVLDGIMDFEHGLRPLDFQRFEQNNKFQQLRVVASSIDSDGSMISNVFGTEEFSNETALILQPDDDLPRRTGFFACLQASMTVPGATGPPVNLLDPTTGKVSPCFDAFCFEPIPYRSAVKEGCTHVLALCTRPENFDLKTKPGVYEQGVAPLYFRSHGYPEVAEFFEKGGQQFIYAEDLLTLEQGKMNVAGKGVLAPPPQCIYGVKNTHSDHPLIQDRSNVWDRAHLLPLKVPETTPELPALENDKNAVLEAVRSGFAAAYDILAPIVLEKDSNQVPGGLTGEDVSKLVFPKLELDNDPVILNTKVKAPGQDIPKYSVPSALSFSSSSSSSVGDDNTITKKKSKFRVRLFKKLLGRRRRRKNNDLIIPPETMMISNATTTTTTTLLSMKQLSTTDPSNLSQLLMSSLPGFSGERGSFCHLSKGLRDQINKQETIF